MKRPHLHVAAEAADDRQPGAKNGLIKGALRKAFTKSISRCSITRCMPSVCGVESAGTRIEQVDSWWSAPPSNPTSESSPRRPPRATGAGLDQVAGKALAAVHGNEIATSSGCKSPRI